jgi:CRISPR-associated protein (TIGR03986 family)
MARFLNPYNFVRPLSAPQNLPPLSEETADLHLLWRCPPPPHDRYTGLSGRITCTMTAKTPVFVSDSDFFYQNEEDEKKKHKTYRFFNVNGQDMIPASSLRGSIRSVFEVATNSTFGILDDQRLSYRETTTNALSLVPGLVAYDRQRKQWQVHLLRGNSGIDVRNNFKPKSTEQDDIPTMYAAWVPQYRRNRTENVDLKGLQHGDYCQALITPQEYRRQGGRVLFRYWRVETLAQEDQQAELQTRQAETTGSRIVDGFLCITNKNISRKHDERLFFSVKQHITHDLNSTIIEDYNLNISLNYQYHVEHQTSDVASRHLVNHPETECIPREGSSRQFLVYVRLRHDAEQQQPVVDYLAPVAIPRVLESQSLHKVLEREDFDHLLTAQDIDQLSLADRVFGWVHPSAAGKSLAVPTAYKGRVNFSHATPQKPLQTLDKQPLSILSAPKPTTTRFYVNSRMYPPNTRANGAEPRDEQIRYGGKGNMLRGRKMYRHHGDLFTWNEAAKHPQFPNSDQNRTIDGAHDINTQYEFTLNFENLQSVELGALLWSLQPWSDACHRLGYGKPLGLGSVQIKVTSLKLYDMQRRYSGDIKDTGDVEAIEEIPTLITRFTVAFAHLYGESFEHLDNIRDLRALLSSPLHLVHYPRKSVNRNREGDKNYEWFKENKPPTRDAPNYLLPYAADDTEGFPYFE